MTFKLETKRYTTGFTENQAKMLAVKYIWFMLLFNWTTIFGKEPACSKFHYEEQLLQKMVQLEFEMEQMKKEMENKILPTIEGLQRTKVAFSAYNPSSLTPNIDQVIVFKDVLLNEGSAYNPFTGTFTATTSGLYHFTVHVCNGVTKGTVVAIVHNGTKLAVSTQYEDANSARGSVSALAMIDVGDAVYVTNPYENTLMREDQHRRASFIGFRLN